MDDLQCSPGLLFLASKVKHQLTAIDDGPVPANQGHRNAIQVEA
jgi:hypothetical protein